MAIDSGGASPLHAATGGRVDALPTAYVTMLEREWPVIVGLETDDDYDCYLYPQQAAGRSPQPMGTKTSRIIGGPERDSTSCSPGAPFASARSTTSYAQQDRCWTSRFTTADGVALVQVGALGYRGRLAGCHSVPPVVRSWSETRILRLPSSTSTSPSACCTPSVSGILAAAARPVSSAKIRVRVAPGSRTAGIVGRHGDGWKIRVTAAPERGRANDEVVRLLAVVLGVERGAVEVVAGRGSRDKLAEIRGLAQSDVEQRLAAAAARMAP